MVVSLHPGAIASLFSKCLEEGSFPKRWLVQKLLLLNDQGKPSGKPSSYMPICLQDTLGMVFEKVISRRLGAAIEEAEGLLIRQYGVRK